MRCRAGGTFAAPKVPKSAAPPILLHPAPVLTPARPGLPSPAFECTNGAFPFTPRGGAPRHERVKFLRAPSLLLQ